MKRIFLGLALCVMALSIAFGVYQRRASQLAQEQARSAELTLDSIRSANEGLVHVADGWARRFAIQQESVRGLHNTVDMATQLIAQLVARVDSLSVRDSAPASVDSAGLFVATQVVDTTPFHLTTTVRSPAPYRTAFWENTIVLDPVKVTVQLSCVAGSSARFRRAQLDVHTASWLRVDDIEPVVDADVCNAPRPPMRIFSLPPATAVTAVGAAGVVVGLAIAGAL